MDLGATTVRFAHYQQSDYLYSRCDTLGLIIWAEIPFVNRVSGKECRAFEDERRFQVNRRDRIPVHDFRLHRAVLGHYLRRSFQVRQQQNGRKHREQTAVHVFDF